MSLTEALVFLFGSRLTEGETQMLASLDNAIGWMEMQFAHRHRAADKAIADRRMAQLAEVTPAAMTALRDTVECALAHRGLTLADLWQVVPVPYSQDELSYWRKVLYTKLSAQLLDEARDPDHVEALGAVDEALEAA